MGFDLVDKTVSDEEFRQYVLHEFGHALGLIHEHQNPQNNPIHWNKEKVYHYYKITQNWSKEKVDTIFFTRFQHEHLMASDFDSQSIMLYAVAREFTIDGFSTSWNSQLSENDKNFIQLIYPK